MDSCPWGMQIPVVEIRVSIPQLEEHHASEAHEIEAKRRVKSCQKLPGKIEF